MWLQVFVFMKVKINYVYSFIFKIYVFLNFFLCFHAHLMNWQFYQSTSSHFLSIRGHASQQNLTSSLWVTFLVTGTVSRVSIKIHWKRKDWDSRWKVQATLTICSQEVLFLFCFVSFVDNNVSWDFVAGKQECVQSHFKFSQISHLPGNLIAEEKSGEMSQLLISWTAHIDNQNLDPSTHIRRLTTTCTPAPEYLTLALTGTYTPKIPTHRCTCIDMILNKT